MKLIKNPFQLSLDFVRDNYPLIIIVSCAAIIRLVFFTDMVRIDDLRYAYAAYEMSEGYFNLGGWVGNARPGLYAPVALLYWLFEPNSITTLAFPYICSLGTVVLVYKIARFHAGEAAGLIAGYIWAFLPLDVFLATDLLADGPLATLSTASVLFFLLARQKTEKKEKTILYGSSLASLIWALYVKPIAAITAIYLAVYILWIFWKKYQVSIISAVQNVPRQRLLAVTVLLITIALIGLKIYDQIQPLPLIVSLHLTYKDLVQQFITGVVDLDYSDLRFTQVDLLLPLGTLILVAIPSFLAKLNSGAEQTLGWLSITFLYYEWGTVSSNPVFYRPIQEIYEARNLLFILPPAVILISIYLAQGIQRFKGTRTTVTAISLGVLGFAWFFQDGIRNSEFFEMFTLLLIIMVVVPIASAFFFSDGNFKYSLATVLILLIGLGLISLNPIDPYHARYYDERRAQLRLAQAQVSYVTSLAPQVIYSDDPIAVDYVSGFQFRHDWKQSNRIAEEPYRIHHLPSNLSEISEGIVIMYTEMQRPPTDWRLLRSFYDDSSGASLFIYRAGTND